MFAGSRWRIAYGEGTNEHWAVFDQLRFGRVEDWKPIGLPSAIARPERQIRSRVMKAFFIVFIFLDWIN